MENDWINNTVSFLIVDHRLLSFSISRLAQNMFDHFGWPKTTTAQQRSNWGTWEVKQTGDPLLTWEKKNVNRLLSLLTSKLLRFERRFCDGSKEVGRSLVDADELVGFHSTEVSDVAARRHASQTLVPGGLFNKSGIMIYQVFET